jgi:cation transport regulator ChaB
MKSRGTLAGSVSPETRTLTPLRRSVIKRHEVHQHEKIPLVTREYSDRETRRRSVAGTSKVSVLVAAVKMTYPMDQKMLNHWREKGCMAMRGGLFTEV